MSKAETTIRKIIKDNVQVINLVMADKAAAHDLPTEYKATIDRKYTELMGMLICLRNIAPEKFYAIYDCKDHIEFGYYDRAGKWNVIA